MQVTTFEARADQLPKLAELQERFGQARDVNAERARGFSRLERVAIFVTDNVGTMGFFFILAAWTAFWLAWNTFGPPVLRFDPGPAFVLWLFISNLIQLHLMPLIMVGQNLQDRYAELRAEADFEVNRKAEAEVETVLGHLANQNDLMLEILRRLDRLERLRTS